MNTSNRCEQLSFSSINKSFTPKASTIKIRSFDDSPNSLQSVKNRKKKTDSLELSLPKKKSKKKCHRAVDVLRLSNNTVKCESENVLLRGMIKEKDEKILGLMEKLRKSEEQFKVKDEMINKLSSFIFNREKQFVEVIQGETEKLNRIIGQRDAEIEASRKKYSAKFVNKAVQVVMDPVYDELFSEKNDEICRLQSTVEKNKNTYALDKAYLEEQILLLEQELEKAQKLFAKHKIEFNLPTTSSDN